MRWLELLKRWLSPQAQPLTADLDPSHEVRFLRRQFKRQLRRAQRDYRRKVVSTLWRHGDVR